MNKVIREEDVLSRIGGDEFLILVRNLQRENFEIILNMLSQDIMNILNEPFLINGSENFITASIGVACYPVDGEDSGTLVMNADIAMYEAKSSGRNNVKICSPEIKGKLIRKTRYRNSLYRAVKNRELMIYYQPQVNVILNKIIGFEALLRWKIDNKSFVAPSEFIPILEETGLIVDVGYWVIESACISLKRCHDLGANDLRMAINLSANQLNEKNFISKVINILNNINLDPAFIEFEITERITLNGDEDIKKKLEELKKIGISISIDDFGTEYSSFRNLKKLPIDKIKIDMEFVQGINKSEKDTAIVSSIIELCHRLGLDVIAEGVETTEQLEFLENKCCNKVQGYLYYKPIPEEDMEKICKYVSLTKML
jgi:EAL domain-containing protein (putative c-di-GMP-specific phosphodiesterase class I)